MGPPLGGDACTSWTLEAVPPFGVNVKDGKEKMLAVKIRYLSANAECGGKITFGTLLDATIVSMYVSVVSFYAVPVRIAGAGPAPAVPAHLPLAVYSQSKQAVDLTPGWTVVGIIAVQFASSAARLSHSPGRLRG